MRSAAALPLAPSSPTSSDAPKRLALVDVLALGAVYVIWGSTYYALRIALDGLPPFLLAGGRFVVAGGLLYGALRLGGAPRPALRQWGAAAIVGALLLAIGNGGVCYGELTVSSSLAAVIVGTMPLWAALFSRLFGQRPTGGEWIGIGLGVAGVVVLNLHGELRGGSALGVAALLVSPVAWALGSVWSRRLPLPGGAMATAAQMLTGGAVMLGIAALRGEALPAALPSARVMGAFAYLVVFGSLVAFTAYVHLLRRVRPSLATSYAYVNPLIAIALGVGLGGEKLSPLGAIAALLIVAGVATAARAKRA